MSCKERNDDLILGLLTGEISPIRAALLRKHIRRCELCHAHLEQMQALWSNLSFLASETAGMDLKQRIADSLPAPQQRVHPITWMEVFRMRKRLVVACVVVLLLAGAALIAGQFVGQSKGRKECTVDGRKWSCLSTFNGRVNFLNPDGSDPHSGAVTLRDNPENGTVDLRVDGDNYTFAGVGRHEVRNSKGELLGFVNMQPAPPPEEMVFGTGTGGLRGTGDGVEGYDQVLDISWNVVGNVKVTLIVPHDVKAGVKGGWAASYHRNGPKVPTLTANTPDGVITRIGYGEFEIPVGDGKAITLKIEEFNPSYQQ